MRDAVAFIQSVSLRESANHLLDARRPVHAQRMVPSLPPRLHVDFAEIADVIGMIMGQHNRAQPPRGNMPQTQVFPRARPDVHQVEIATREDRRARILAITISQWISRAA